MLTLTELRKNKTLVNAINWDMPIDKREDPAPDREASQYVGTGEYLYFVLNSKEEKPQVTLVQKKQEEMPNP